MDRANTSVVEIANSMLENLLRDSERGWGSLFNLMGKAMKENGEEAKCMVEEL